MKQYQVIILIIIVILIIVFNRRIRRFFNLLMSKYTYFTLSEFDSPDQPGSGEKYMDKTFVRRLDKARERTKSNKNEFPNGVAFVILSGARTPSHNKKVGGVKNSAHVIIEGKKVAAVDIDYNTEAEKIAILKALINVGFNRFGIRTGASGSSIHVDSDETKPQFAVWGYNGVEPTPNPFNLA